MMRLLRAVPTILLLSTLAAHAADKKGAADFSSLPAAAQARISSTLGHESAEFYAHPVGDGFEACSGGLAARFHSTGIEVSSGEVRWGLALRGYGYGDALRKAELVVPRGTKNRVEYQRGAMTEWYVNGPMGLEQGFTIKERPGKANGRPLTIALETSGNLTPIAEDNAGLTLKTASGHETLRYGGLTAYDADGKDLHAGLRLQGQQLLLQVDDSNARYPVVVDPVVQLAKLTSSDGPVIGQSVSISGNVIVASAMGRGGAAYVFVKPPSGWHDMTQTARLTGSDEIPTDAFGSSVAISGNVIVVGAPGAKQNQGAAYVFLKPPGGWKDMTETAKLVASDGAPGDDFGVAVSVSGGTAVIGANFATVNGMSQGAAYVFERPMAVLHGALGPTLTETAKLTASDPTGGGDSFGISASISGDTVAIGAFGGNRGSGEAYVFVKPPTGWTNMTETAALTSSDTGGLLGLSVATNGTTVAAGASSAGLSHEGAVYVYVRPDNGWVRMTETAQLSATKCCWSFGQSVAVNATGQAIAVGAPQGNGHRNGTGDAFVFLKPPTGWQTTTQYQYRLFSSDAVVRELFGMSVSLAGKILVSGAPAANNQGAAYVFGTK